MSSGLIARKVGMSRVFLPTGEAVPVTYLEVEPNVVVRTKTKEKDGYNAVVLGIGAKQWKSRKGKEHVRYALQKEWQVDSLDGLEPGKKITAEAIPVESLVSITGVSKGKGFQGVMRRHHFAGGPGSHGSHFKREPGSVGMRTSPGRILKGHRMAGRMGGDQISIKNRSIVSADSKKGILAVKGPVPGPNGAAVYVTLESPPAEASAKAGSPPPDKKK
ncbi:50S ribosomal protein L3 [Candidatus Peregrinibacteria bacterium]|nr:50S ribosomal protein L3 [Candidatus Peregrinibacteria bacterium]